MLLKRGQSMAFASLNLPLLRRSILSISGVVFASISCLGQTPFSPVQSTPYDRQMTRVFPALNSASMQKLDSISLLAVSDWMLRLRDIPYQYSNRWQTPAEVDLTQTADCKGKAVSLYAQMRRSGAKNVRIVIGRRHIFDARTHAWLEWQAREGSYVLDPTFNYMPTRTAELSPATYVPFYAYDGARKYRAKNAGSSEPAAQVATGTYVPARTALTFARPALAGAGPKPDVSSTPVRTITTQNLQLNGQRTVSSVRRSSPNAEGVSKTRATTFKAKSVVSTHRKSAVAGKRALAQKGHGRHGRHVVSSAARPRHVRGPVLAQNEDL